MPQYEFFQRVEKEGFTRISRLKNSGGILLSFKITFAYYQCNTFKFMYWLILKNFLNFL
ncbi:hypothetical protein SK128_024343, partial [Halocaridina rubra]